MDVSCHQRRVVVRRVVGVDAINLGVHVMPSLYVVHEDSSLRELARYVPPIVPPPPPRYISQGDIEAVMKPTTGTQCPTLLRKVQVFFYKCAALQRHCDAPQPLVLNQLWTTRLGELSPLSHARVSTVHLYSIYRPISIQMPPIFYTVPCNRTLLKFSSFKSLIDYVRPSA